MTSAFQTLSRRCMTVSALLVLAACSGGSGTDLPFYLDNPTDQPLTVRIDGKDHVLAAHSGADVALEPGKHALSAPAVGDIEFIVYKRWGDQSALEEFFDGNDYNKSRRGGLINPTLADYVIVREIYAVDDKAASHVKPGQRKIELNGMRYQGAIEIVNGLFIGKDWKYGVHEDFAESETSSTQQSNIFAKIFTAADFDRYYRQNYGTPEPAKTAPQDPEARKARALAPPAPFPDFDSPDMQKVAQPLRDLVTRYQTAADPAAQADIQKEYTAQMQGIVTEYMKVANKLSEKDRQKYNDFIVWTGATIGKPALVIGTAK
ncbi:MAG: hypothetical protein LBV44_02550 [Methylobacillus sp.]|nr:hypothetical protein [Methylobacillus sp.]